MAYTRDDFARALLAKMKLEDTRKRRIALVAWAAAENTKAKFNPLATTHTCPGSTDYNDNVPPVQNFRSFEDGVQVTFDTLEQLIYRKIRRLFDADAEPRRILEEVAASPWGTHNALGPLDDVEENYRKAGDVPLAQ